MHCNDTHALTKMYIYNHTQTIETYKDVNRPCQTGSHGYSLPNTHMLSWTCQPHMPSHFFNPSALTSV